MPFLYACRRDVVPDDADAHHREGIWANMLLYACRRDVFRTPIVRSCGLASYNVGRMHTCGY